MIPTVAQHIRKSKMHSPLLTSPAKLLEEEAHDFATNVLTASLLMIHDTHRCRQHDMSELTRWQEIGGELLDAAESHIEARRDDTALVDAPDEIDHNLAGAMVVNDLDVANVTMFLHHLQKLDDHLRVGPDECLTLATLLGIHDAVEAVTEHADTDHCCLKRRRSRGDSGTTAGQP